MSLEAFVALTEALDQSRGSKAKLEVLAAYLKTTAAAEPAEAAWALHCLLGDQRRRLITARRLRQIAQQAGSLPDWLFEDCYSQVGDTAETIALLWRHSSDGGRTAVGTPANSPPITQRGLRWWMEELLPGLAGLEQEAQAAAVGDLWNQLPPEALLVTNKLLCGGFRLGVAKGLLIQAVAQLAALDASLIQHRLMGGRQPSAGFWQALVASEQDPLERGSRPYPFCLASPLPASSEPAGEPLPGSPQDWLVEWKWDGIRGQLIRRNGGSWLWSRGEELITGAFPELEALAGLLPDGTVLDGEVIIWPEGQPRPAPFAELQRRLGRLKVPRSLLTDCPAAFVAYDLLERHDQDLRAEPLQRRRQELEHLVQELQTAAGDLATGRLRLSNVLALRHWQELPGLRARARDQGAEGLMLKQWQSPYRGGRRRGSWWKHKLEPLRLDAVLLYARSGSGRRANLLTDYSFGLWNEAGELVTFAQAYSGLAAAEISELDRWIRGHTVQRFGPVRSVEPALVFELAFEGLQPSKRHRSGIAVRFPRISRWRRDKSAAQASTLAEARELMDPAPLPLVAEARR
ncbi:MAG: ATP-dependent DNA ligase [Synechococcaceae cyanobacterium]|nr:ATP-dependent DNA ligase [Synechococcaceae cyanobacterium]